MQWDDDSQGRSICLRKLGDATSLTRLVIGRIRIEAGRAGATNTDTPLTHIGGIAPMQAARKSIPFPVPPQQTQSKPRRSVRTHLTPEEILCVLKAARAHSVRDWAMILVAYRHGLRASEMCGLRIADIDLKAGSISIRRLKGSMSQTQPLYPHRGQPLLDEVKALRSWLRDRPEDGSDFLFTSQKGGKLDRTQFFRIFRAHAEAVALATEKRHPHVLKHSLASHLVAGNVNLALVRQALGHRSITSTMQYVGTSDGQAAEAAQAALMRLY